MRNDLEPGRHNRNRIDGVTGKNSGMVKTCPRPIKRSLVLTMQAMIREKVEKEQNQEQRPEPRQAKTAD